MEKLERGMSATENNSLFELSDLSVSSRDVGLEAAKCDWSQKSNSQGMGLRLDVQVSQSKYKHDY